MWKNLLGSVKESVDEELRLRNAYMVAENRILRRQINGCVQLTDNDCKELVEIGAKLGKKALEEIATVVRPDTILAWNRKFVGQQVDTSTPRKAVGRPCIDQEVEDFVVRMARENRSWGYDRIVGALANLGYTISDQTVGNILKRHSIPPAPERTKTVTWQEFIRLHIDILLATGFFTQAVWCWLGLVISAFLCFIRCSPGHVYSVGMTLPHHMRWLWSLLPRALDVNARAQGWMRLVKVSVQVRQILCAEGVLGPPISAFASSDDRKPRCQGRG